MREREREREREGLLVSVGFSLEWRRDYGRLAGEISCGKVANGIVCAVRREIG